MINKKLWRGFLTLFQNASAQELDMLFHLFMTMDEREMLVGRYELVRAHLSSDLTHREIAKTLQQSISKVTAGSKAVQLLKEKDKEYLLKRMKDPL